MSFHKILAIFGAIAMASHVAAHGTVTGIVADGVYYQGYHANFQYMQTQPVVVGWSIPEDLSNGFIAPAAYTNPDIICHLNATNAQASATVKAGGTVEMQWTAWPSSHHGPVIDYLASCDGDCKTVDKNKLEFFKIDGVGLIGDATVPGTWASDQLIANNNSWVVTIPIDIAPGKYVLRHEIIALHSAEQVNGAQNYPQCVNLEVTGSGTATPSGVLGTALYSETDPGIEINIYTSLSTYIVPGPALYSDAISVSQTAVVTSSRAAAIATVSSAPSQIPSAPVAKITTSSSGGFFLQTSGGPHFNSTSTSIKSACKAKSSAISGAAVTTPEAVAAATTSSEATLIIPTLTIVETIATLSVPAVAFSSLTPTSTTSSKAAFEPAGTTLSDLLSWISSFYNKFKGTSYDGNTVARRHARDVARAEIEKFDGASFAAGATQPGCPHPTGYHHHSHATGYPLGTKCTKPTGAVTSMFPEPTTGGYFTATELHPCEG